MRRLIPTLAGAILFAGCASDGGRGPTLSEAPVAPPWAIEDANWNTMSRDGDVFFAGQPTLAGIDALPDAGVRTVINLRMPEEMLQSLIGFDERAAVMRRGMEYIRIPVNPATLSRNDIDRLAETLSRRVGPVVIHSGSADRAGGVWALYLHLHRGHALEEAIEIGRGAGLRSEAMLEAVRRVGTGG